MEGPHTVMKCRTCRDSGYMRVRIPLRPLRASDFTGELDGAEEESRFREESRPCAHCEAGREIENRGKR